MIKKRISLLACLLTAFVLVGCTNPVVQYFSSSERDLNSIIEKLNNNEELPKEESEEKKIEEVNQDVNQEANQEQTTSEADSLFDAFLKGEINAFNGEHSISIKDLDIGGDDITTSYEVGERLDLDNDGENELILLNDIDGGMFLDAMDGKINVFARGEGTAARLTYTKYQDSFYVVYCDVTHGGREMYDFTRYEGANNIVEQFSLNAEYWDSDYYDSNSDFTYRGKKISMQEYEKAKKELFAYFDENNQGNSNENGIVTALTDIVDISKGNNGDLESVFDSYVKNLQSLAGMNYPAYLNTMDAYNGYYIYDLSNIPNGIIDSLVKDFDQDGELELFIVSVQKEIDTTDEMNLMNMKDDGTIQLNMYEYDKEKSQLKRTGCYNGCNISLYESGYADCFYSESDNSIGLYAYQTGAYLLDGQRFYFSKLHYDGNQFVEDIIMNDEGSGMDYLDIFIDDLEKNGIRADYDDVVCGKDIAEYIPNAKSLGKVEFKLIADYSEHQVYTSLHSADVYFYGKQ